MAVDTVQEVKGKLSIEEVVKPYVKLSRAGKSLVGLCPFHKEKTPSFHVSPERGSYHCFGCGEGGDIFSFIEKVEGVDFKGALKILAEKAGVRVEYAPKDQVAASKRERLASAMTRAAQWYEGQLPGSAAESYAKGRGLLSVTINGWGLGYAPDTWRALLEALGAEGYTVEELVAAGLVKEAAEKPGTYYDRFRNRLMFPVRDGAGKVVAFTGRALNAEDPAKYLNSPETDLYHKSDVLFGLDRAKDAIRMRGFTLLVEGQMDVLHAHQAGFENAVALSGTALSGKHLALAKRYSDNLMLILDADSAGLKATAAAAQLALREDIRVKAARLPSGEDPADLITRDSKEFAARVKAAQPITEFFLGVLAERQNDSSRLLRHVEAVVLPLIALMKSPMEREHAAQVTARALGLSSESVRESLNRVGRRQEAGGSATQGSSRPSTLHPKPAPTARRAELLTAAIHAYPGSALASRVEAEYIRITGDQVPLREALPELLLFQAEQQFGEAPGERVADELLRAFEEAVIREAYQEAVANLRRAESSGDVVLVKAAGAKCGELSARLAALKS